ncbi:MAG: UDP-N-acetylmuramoyl-L-alanine--D-glutamate ligase [Planctomycetota bacterium]
MRTLPERYSRALVHGLGRFGGNREAIRFLHRRGVRVRVCDRSAGADLDESRRFLANLRDVDWQLGREDPALLDGVDLLVVNPAVPDEHPLLAAARARGIEITQEINLFLDSYPGKVIGVTGTNGKSTTSVLLHGALARGGVPALLGGNIGQSLLSDAAHWRRDQVAVVELSSFQLQRVDLDRHRFHGAVYTAVGRDHLDRHGTLEAYRAAKSRLAAMAESFVVHPLADPVAAAFASSAKRYPYTTERPAPGSTGIENGWLTARLGERGRARIVHQDAMVLLGEFQRENAMAAATAALLCGADPRGVGLALALARPLPFRLQYAGSIGGVPVFDNGVSTEVESTKSALSALGKGVRWVGGGKSKDGDYASVAKAVAPHLASAHLFGAAASPLSAELGDAVPWTRHETLREALDAALEAARPGEKILFSPAFASFDQYPNFRARALEFRAWLEERRGGRSPRASAAVG